MTVDPRLGFVDGDAARLVAIVTRDEHSRVRDEPGWHVPRREVACVVLGELKDEVQVRRRHVTLGFGAHADTPVLGRHRAGHAAQVR